MFNKLLILSSICLFSTNSFSEDIKDNHPCQKIKSACESAGLIKGNHKSGKELYKDCLQPILERKTVAGVTVSSQDISSCNEKKAEHKAIKEGKK